jgi:anti-sigma factor RsiW
MTEQVHLRHVRHVLSEYLEGELRLNERQTVEKHLKVCPACQQEMRVLRRTVNLLLRLPRETTPTDFMDKLKIRIEQYEVKSRSMAEPVPAAPLLTTLVQWMFGLGRLLFFPPPARIPLYIGTVILGLATILLRTSSEQTTTTQILPTVSATPRSEALPQKMVSVADETPQAVTTAGPVPEQTLSPATSPPSPVKALNVGSALVWRVTGSEPTILRQQVKALVSQKVEAVVVQEEERLLVISLPTARLPALHQELNALGTVNLPEAEIVPTTPPTPTTVVHIEFIRSPSVVAPLNPTQLPDHS